MRGMDTEFDVDTTNLATFDKGEDQPYDPKLYEAAVVADRLDGLAAVDEQQVAVFHEQGYLAIENAVEQCSLDNAAAAIEDLIDGHNESFECFYFEGWARDKLAQMTRDQRYGAIRKLMDFCRFDKRFEALSQHAGLAKLVSRLSGGPVKVIQEMSLFKMPGGREKPWHQDHAYFNVPLDSRIIGVWIALDEATAENGCMHLLAGGHRDGPIAHFQRRDWQICNTDILGQTLTAVPLKPGGVLVFDSLLPHGTPANVTEQSRRAMQFHYAPAVAGKVTDQDRMAVFGTEGKDVTC